MNVFRCPQNPVIRPADVKAYRDDFEVTGVFNPGVIRFGDEIILLLRVAENPVNKDSETLLTAFYDETSDSVLMKKFSSLPEKKKVLWRRKEVQ